jgi:hypothetical protein
MLLLIGIALGVVVVLSCVSKLQFIHSLASLDGHGVYIRAHKSLFHRDLQSMLLWLCGLSGGTLSFGLTLFSMGLVSKVAAVRNFGPGPLHISPPETCSIF